MKKIEVWMNDGLIIRMDILRASVNIHGHLIVITTEFRDLKDEVWYCFKEYSRYAVIGNGENIAW